MATRVDLHRDYTKRALEQALASLKRGLSKDINPAMKQLIEQDIALYQTAINTLTEVK